MTAAVADAAIGAAAIMGMNNIYYRFIHSAKNRDESQKLRTNLTTTVSKEHGINRVDFELFSVAVSAMNGCGLCFDSHGRILRRYEVPLETIQAAVRIGATINALAKSHSAIT